MLAGATFFEFTYTAPNDQDLFLYLHSGTHVDWEAPTYWVVGTVE